MTMNLRMEGMVFDWLRGKQEIPPNMVQLSSAPLDDWGEPIWNEEIELQARNRGSDFLAPFLVETSPGMCMGGYIARAQYRNSLRNYEATAVLLTRKNDELQTTLLIVAPACQSEGLQWPGYTQRLCASLPKEHVRNMVHTLRGLCEQAHAQELLKAGSRPTTPNKPDKEEASAPILELNGFAVNEFVVYPAHGVGQILAIEQQKIAGADLALFVINFPHEKMTLCVPASKVANVGMRKISSQSQIDAALSLLGGRDDDLAEQMTELSARINSGDILQLAGVVRELRPWRGREELYKAALARLTQEIAVARALSDSAAANEVESRFSHSA